MWLCHLTSSSRWGLHSCSPNLGWPALGLSRWLLAEWLWSHNAAGPPFVFPPAVGDPIPARTVCSGQPGVILIGCQEVVWRHKAELLYLLKHSQQVGAFCGAGGVSKACTFHCWALVPNCIIRALQFAVSHLNQQAPGPMSRARAWPLPCALCSPMRHASNMPPSRQCWQ